MQNASLATAVGLTLPVGAQQASGTSCNLSGSLLTVGGTVTGTFATGQYVKGTGIPANTYITGPGTVANTWNLSNTCTTETGETVTGYAPLAPDFAIIWATTATVYWRDDGVTPTSGNGVPLLTTAPPFEYYGSLGAIQFISATGAINVSFYKLVG
jgi:hypothetical protein